MKNLKRHKRAGFTLLEILVALSLLSVTAFAIMTAFIQGIRIYSRFGGILDREEKSFFIERITRDLKNSALYSQIPWTITSSAITFASIPVQAEETIENLSAIPVRVVYRFDEEKKEVTRTESFFSDTAESTKTEVVATDVRSLKFEVLRDNEEAFPARITVLAEYGSVSSPKQLKKIILLPLAYKEKI